LPTLTPNSKYFTSSLLNAMNPFEDN